MISRTKPETSSVILLPQIDDYSCGYTHLIVFTHACGYYSRVATIRGAASIRINTVHFFL